MDFTRRRLGAAAGATVLAATGLLACAPAASADTATTPPLVRLNLGSDAKATNATHPKATGLVTVELPALQNSSRPATTHRSWFTATVPKIASVTVDPAGLPVVSQSANQPTSTPPPATTPPHGTQTAHPDAPTKAAAPAPPTRRIAALIQRAKADTPARQTTSGATAGGGRARTSGPARKPVVRKPVPRADDSISAQLFEAMPHTPLPLGLLAAIVAICGGGTVALVRGSVRRAS